jgi:hypothetical protein
MKTFMLLHVGFVEPTPEIMGQWRKWFESIADRQVAQGGFARGCEVNHDGRHNLQWDKTSITGYNIIEAEDLDEATEIANTNPFITSIRIYELREM